LGSLLVYETQSLFGNNDSQLSCGEIYSVCEKAGFNFPLICTPAELMEEGKE